MSRPLHFGLLGHNIDYSLSPQIFSAIFDILNVEGKFSIFDISPDKLSASLIELSNLDGFSVTIPHKRELEPWLDSLAPEASKIGAVNSVKVTDGKFSGYNTDWIGFLSSLAAHNFANKRILILGGGGAARAVLYGLLSKYGPAEIVVAGRNKKTISDMVIPITSSFSSSCKISSALLIEIHQLGPFDLIVNCTPVGSANLPNENPLGDEFDFASLPLCYDLIYDPAMTIFLKQADKAGCETINGLPMLIFQALESYQIWTGKQLEMAQVYKDVKKRLDQELNS